jgi:hypothetical protein
MYFAKPHVQKIIRGNTDWRCGARSTMSDLQAQSSEFKPQSHQKKKRIKESKLLRQR